MGGRGGLFLFAVGEPEFLHLVAQCVAADVQQLGRLDLVAMRLPQRPSASVRKNQRVSRGAPVPLRAPSDASPGGEISVVR
jgi:hypothetical protein